MNESEGCVSGYGPNGCITAENDDPDPRQYLTACEAIGTSCR